ncbi:hypothetical protein V496_06586 [Pseudogymnoascus sp. VKM F-4515 (FW-2607)]|nr:hypothetical protein V496_06586 [Pseudogymnoascus sp. VKM F-4515 (FW-2607)]
MSPEYTLWDALHFRRCIGQLRSHDSIRRWGVSFPDPDVRWEEREAAAQRRGGCELGSMRRTGLQRTDLLRWRTGVALFLREYISFAVSADHLSSTRSIDDCGADDAGYIDYDGCGDDVDGCERLYTALGTVWRTGMDRAYVLSG